jgi:hypothetical protein
VSDIYDRIAEVHERSERAIQHSESLRGDDRLTCQDDEEDQNPYDEDDEEARREELERRIEAAEQRNDAALERAAQRAKDIFSMGVDAMKAQRGVR